MKGSSSPAVRTRLFPLTIVTNKHLLPIYDRPMIYYPIEALVNAGVTDIMIVTGGKKSGDFLSLLGNGSDFGLKHLNYTYQKGEGGIAEALGLCEHWVAGDDVCVVLGDNIIERNIARGVANFEPGGGRRSCWGGPRPAAFGVAELKGDRVMAIEEKPKTPRTNLAVIRIYVRRVFEVIRP
jgi:glucose-1-phosphate thymidylyltransferase